MAGMKYMKGMIDRARRKAQIAAEKYSPFKPVTDALGKATEGGAQGPPKKASPPPVQERKKIKPKKTSYYD